jgi:AraC-like DNA-binding protein
MEESYVKTWKQEGQLFQELCLWYCGCSDCHPGHSFGPAARPNYILHYVLKGKGRFQIDNRTYEIGAEEGFLIVPNVMTFYQADSNDPWSYVWIGFHGDAAEKLLGRMGLSFRMPTFSSNCGQQLSALVADMLGQDAQNIGGMLHLQSQFYQFFGYIAQGLAVQDNFQQGKQNYYVRTAVEFIEQHYADSIKVTDIAESIGVSRSYLVALFQNILGMPPNAYLSGFRISRAKELLTITEMSVGEIASRCGYQDALVFSKAFKHHVGMTPTLYRKTDRAKQHMRIQQMKKM